MPSSILPFVAEQLLTDIEKSYKERSQREFENDFHLLWM